KFVKGDAMAAVLITAINLIGGIVVGVVQQGLPIGEAINHFSLLSVGDGLCAQIPALLISVATGIIVTRSASEKDLGSDLASQVLKQRKAPLVAGGVICAFALVPGLPKLPFLIIGGPPGWRAADGARAEAGPLCYTVVAPESVIGTHLPETIRANVSELLTRQDVRALLDALKEHNAAVVEEVVPELLSVGEIQRVLQSLLRENVSIRDLGTIVEAVGDRARLTRDPALLAEHARQALSRAIVAPHLDAEMQLRAIALDPNVEQEVSDAIAQTSDGEFLAMNPTRAQALVGALATQVEHAVARGRRPVLICSS